MTDIWDFSPLLESWGERAKTPTAPEEGYTQITEQMQKELDDIAAQLSLLDASDTTTLNSLNLLTIPVPPPTPPMIPPVQQAPRFSMVKLPPLVTKPLIVKPKEPMQMRAKAVSVSRAALHSGPIFKATPDRITVVNFTLATEYVRRFTLQNISSHTHGFQIRGPTHPAFQFRILEEIPNSEIRPGLHLTFEVIFTPMDPQDYETSIVIIPGEHEIQTVITLRCYRDPPDLQLPPTVNLGATLVHSAKSGEFTIKNDGGIAFFSFSSPTGHENSLIFVDSPFSLAPSEFELNHGESIRVKIEFKPSQTGPHSAEFTVQAQHFKQTFSFIAMGDAAVPILKFGICEETRLLLPFLPCDVNTTRTLTILNDADVSYPFHVQILRPRDSSRSELALLYPETDTTQIKTGSSPFSVSPANGLIAAKESIEISVSFAPTLFAFYRANLVLFADRIPDETGTLGSRKMLTIAAEATTGPPAVSLAPPFVLFSEVIPRTATRQAIDVVNDSHLDVKLQWRKSEAITPSPVVFNVAPKQRVNVELTCLMAQRLAGGSGSANSIFKHQPEMALQYQNAGADKSVQADPAQPPPSSRHYAIACAMLADTQATVYDADTTPETVAGEAERDDDEMPNIFSLKHWSSAQNVPAAVAGPLETLAKVRDAMAVKLDPLNEIPLSFSAEIASPVLTVTPPVLDFGCVLAGEKAVRGITLTNNSGCQIGFHVTCPGTPEWDIPNPTGIVRRQAEVAIQLMFYSHTALSSLITITSWWVNDDGKEIDSMPTFVCDVPVFAVFDRPLLRIDERVLNVGDVFPTIQYRGSMRITLLNPFPTDFTFTDYSTRVTLPDQGPSPSAPAESPRSASQPSPRSTGGISSARSQSALGASARESGGFEEFARAAPGGGHLELGQTAAIELVAKFCGLGQRALPFVCKVTGGFYTCAVIANVSPPLLKLHTELIDFSGDFKICNRSWANVVVTNECGVASTVRLEMVDDCNHVFSLDDTSVKNVVRSVEIPVSCYSEIHGDYNGMLKLIVKDPWQYKEISIPLHVKALGSFFGFQKHILGYMSDVDGDYVTFGQNIPAHDTNVIRRLTLENFSSEAITVDWSIANFVRNRRYADLELNVD
jgi:hypothetical protein